MRKPKKKTSVLFVYALLFALCAGAQAQQAKKVPRIGFLSASTADAYSNRTDAFRQELGKLGWTEGKNITIEYRSAEGNNERLLYFAAEFVRLNVDVIVAANNVAARACAGATKTIPIVMASGADPVATGLVASLAKPGGNVTGVTNLATDIGVKRLELLKEIFPRATRVAVLTRSPTAGEFNEMQAAAPSLQIQLEVLKVQIASDFQKVFKQATTVRAAALAVTADGTGLFAANTKQIVELAAKNRLPTIYPSSIYVSSGGLMSYSASQTDNYRRAAFYVDKILKGAMPADLPVEQSMKFEFIVNLKAAKQIGLTIPPNVLARADRVIR